MHDRHLRDIVLWTASAWEAVRLERGACRPMRRGARSSLDDIHTRAVSARTQGGKVLYLAGLKMTGQVGLRGSRLSSCPLEGAWGSALCCMSVCMQHCTNLSMSLHSFI